MRSTIEHSTRTTNPIVQQQKHWLIQQCNEGHFLPNTIVRSSVTQMWRTEEKWYKTKIPSVENDSDWGTWTLITDTQCPMKLHTCSFRWTRQNESLTGRAESERESKMDASVCYETLIKHIPTAKYGLSKNYTFAFIHVTLNMPFSSIITWPQLH